MTIEAQGRPPSTCHHLKHLLGRGHSGEGNRDCPGRCQGHVWAEAQIERSVLGRGSRWAEAREMGSSAGADGGENNTTVRPHSRPSGRRVRKDTSAPAGSSCPRRPPVPILTPCLPGDSWGLHIALPCSCPSDSSGIRMVAFTWHSRPVLPKAVFFLPKSRPPGPYSSPPAREALQVAAPASGACCTSQHIPGVVRRWVLGKCCQGVS